MVRSHHNTPGVHDCSLMTELRVVRRRAQKLLGQLRADRALTEERWAESGRTDPVKTVTGQSALDNAVRLTEGMIHSVDCMTAEVAGTRFERVGPVTTITMATAAPVPISVAP